MSGVTASSRGRSRQGFFAGAASAMVAATFVGFAPSYYLAGLTGAPVRGGFVHVHAFVFTAWMLLYAAQTGLVAARRTDLHRRLGAAGAVLAVAVVVTGVFIALDSARTGGGGPQRDQLAFLVFPLTNILAFAALCGAGVASRGRPARHKRLMLLATLALVVTPLARISLMAGLPVRGAVGGMLLSDLVLAALAVFDVRTLGRPHPATLWAGGALLASEPLRVLVGQTQTWRDFAAALIG